MDKNAARLVHFVTVVKIIVRAGNEETRRISKSLGPEKKKCTAIAGKIQESCVCVCSFAFGCVLGVLGGEEVGK